MALVKDWVTNTGSHQVLHRFENGYGASVIRGPYSYGGSEGLWEIAVIKWDESEYALTYDTPVTNDVLGYLQGSEVQDILDQIESLPSNEEENN